LGMTDEEIRYAFTSGGVGTAEANGIIDGRFTPNIPSTDVADQIRNQLQREGRTRLLEQIDFGQLNRMTEERVNEPLRTAPEQRPEVLGPRPSPARTTGNPFMQAPAAAPQQPSVNPFMQAPAAPAPVNPFLQQGAAPVSPTLLGETPAEQAANMQIAQATGRV
jgi:hypothetical protein